MSLSPLLRRTFVDPLRYWRRVLVYAGVFLGVLGFGLLNTVSAYDFAAGGTADLLGYFIGLHAPLCFLLAPLLYLGFTAFEGRAWRLAIVALQLATVALFLAVPHTPLLQGLAGALLAAPFWTAFHIGMVQNTSDGETGFEVSLAGLFGTAGGIAALGIGGLSLSWQEGSLGASIALAALLGGTLFLLSASRLRERRPLRDFIADARAIARQNRFLTKQVAMLGLFDVPSFALLALMREVQFLPALATMLLVSRVLANIVLAPWLGKIANSLSSRAVRNGFACVFVSWALLLVTGFTSLAFVPALIIYGFGQNLVGGVVNVSWYRMRNYASMALHELFLGVGRMIGFLLFIPLLKVDVRLYAGMILLVSLACLLLNRRWAAQDDDGQVAEA